VTGAGGVQLHYLDFGGTGTPIVLLPGAGNSAWIYLELGHELARDHRVYALTRRGHGESDLPATGYDSATLDADLVAFFDQMKIGRAVLVGHSLAGAELTYFAKHHPDRLLALVYLDAAYDRSIQQPFMEAAPYSPPDPTAEDRKSVENYVAYWRRTRLDLARYWTRGVQRDLQAGVVMREDHTAGWRMFSIFGEYWSAAAAAPPDYSGITVPVLAIYAHEDERYMLPADASSELIAAQQAYIEGPLTQWRKTSIAQLVQAVPSAEIIDMDAGHHMFLHRPVETLKYIRAFLARVPAESP
jgi:pimeloyl-ACP methyl ester carboxylesterase